MKQVGPTENFWISNHCSKWEGRHCSPPYQGLKVHQVHDDINGKIIHDKWDQVSGDLCRVQGVKDIVGTWWSPPSFYWGHKLVTITTTGGV